MLGIKKGTIILIALAYGGYHYYTTHDVTPFPPTNDIVKRTIKASSLTYRDTTIQVTKSCRRISGSVLDKSVFTCGVEFDDNGKTREADIRITKSKGKWLLKE